MRNPARDELEQVVIATRYNVAFDDLVELGNAAFETAEIALAMFAERDFGKYREVFTQLAEIHVCAIARDISGLFQALDPRQAGARRKADRIGQFHVGDPALLLELGKDLEVYPVELGSGQHGLFPRQASCSATTARMSGCSSSWSSDRSTRSKIISISSSEQHSAGAKPMTALAKQRTITPLP